MFDVAQMEHGNRITIDKNRDSRLTPFGIATLVDRYLMPEEGPQDLFARVAMYYGDDSAHVSLECDVYGPMQPGCRMLGKA